MAVYIFESDAPKKIAEVESQEYLKQQKNFGDYSFNAFRKKWRKLYKKSPHVKKLTQEFHISVNQSSTIYGFGGWHRYIVLNTGEICFIRASCIGGMFHQREHVALVKRVGFRIW